MRKVVWGTPLPVFCAAALLLQLLVLRISAAGWFVVLAAGCAFVGMTLLARRLTTRS